MPLDPVIVARIVALIQDGRRQRETARIVGRARAVQNVYQRYEETGLITRRPGSGRKRITIQRDDRFLVSTSLPNRTASAVFLVFILNGSLTGHRYITEVLEDHVMPFMITMGEHGILMHDNARPHAAAPG
jgi:hypothetical protein